MFLLPVQTLYADVWQLKDERWHKKRDHEREWRQVVLVDWT